MDILDKAYDYIDYTLEELAKLEATGVSLLYFFKLFSPAGQLAQHLLIDHSFIEVEKENSIAVIGITERGRAVIEMGGIREYLDHLDAREQQHRRHIQSLRNLLKIGACIAGSVLIFFIIRQRLY